MRVEAESFSEENRSVQVEVKTVLFRTITVKELREHEGCSQWIDVRSATEFAGGHLPGAVNMGLIDGHAETVKLQMMWHYYWHLNWNMSMISR